MEGEKYPVKRLNRSEFAAALRKGQGRTLLHVTHYGLEDVADMVLEACLHNQVYDQQLESERGEWLFSMFRDSPHLPEFKAAILHAIETETDTWNLMQLSSLTKEIAALGDNQAHQSLRNFAFRIAAHPASDDWLGAQDWIDLEGAQGMLDLARIYGQRLLENPDDFVNDHLIQFEEDQDFKYILNEHSKIDVAINAYREYLEKRDSERSSRKPLDKETGKLQNHERVRKTYSLQGIMDDAKKGVGIFPGHYVTFGKHATPEELERIYIYLMSESEESIRTRLLWVFRRAKLPRLDESLFDWANGAEEELRAASINALAQISDERVHDLARMKAETGSLLGADNDALDLFQHNYENNDAPLITKSLLGLRPNPEDAHSLGYGIIELAKRYEDPGLAEAVMWVYENTPCAFCRHKAIAWLDRFHQFPDTLRFECRYDAEDDIRVFAQRI